MARGNWQRRVEKTEARRAANKQRKQKIDNRASFKAMAATLVAQLDTSCYSRLTTGTIHVWTDTTPADTEPVLDDLDEEEDPRAKRRGRSGSFQNETPPLKPRKPSAYNSGKKKAHPRSRETDPYEVEEESHDSFLMCFEQFYRGQCKSLKGGKKGAKCCNVHYTKNHKTLYDMIGKDHPETLLNAEGIMREGTDDVEETGGVELLHYLCVELPTGDVETHSIGTFVSKALSDKACKHASLVYVALNDHLIFDRYQGGILESEFAICLGDGTRRLRSTSVASEASQGSENDEGADAIPASVLEYILLFLPDTAVSAMSRVCRSWSNEIGTTSPHLWRQLLHRRKWPIAPQFTAAATVDEVKDTFTNHYEVLRDVRAIKEALVALANPRKGVPEEEMVYQNFATRRNAPAPPNGCVAVEVWSTNKMIAAFVDDCTIRLFKAIDKGPDGGKSCRELVSVCLDPYVKTKRQNSRLVAMGLDDGMIGCLLQVESVERDRKHHVLIVVSRDDYLEAAGNETALGWSELEDEALHVIDIGEAVVHFFVSADEVDARLLRLTDFLQYGGEIEEVEVLVSPSVVACGYGRFLVEVTISIPDLDISDNDDDGSHHDAMIMLDRKFAIFSSSDDAIIWMGDSNPAETLIPRQEFLTMYGMRHGAPGSQIGCSMVAVTSSSPTILLSEIDPTGFVHSLRTIEAAGIVRAELLSSSADWQIETERQRPVALTPTCVVAIDVLFKDRVDGSRDQNSVISFFPRFSDVEEISYQTIELKQTCVLYMSAIRENHVLLICEELTTRQAADGDDALEEVDGQWFAGETEEERSVSLHAVIVYVPTRDVLERIILPRDRSFYEALQERQPLLFASSSNAVCVGAWWKGVIMTGSDVRSVGILKRNEEADMTPNKVNKKKKKQGRQRGKKDGFARGMTMRG